MLHLSTQRIPIGIFSAILFVGFSMSAESVPYRTSFEQPDYSLGSVDSQDGWMDVTATGSGIVQGNDATRINNGGQSLRIEPSSVISRDIAPAGGLLYIDGYYQGPTVSATIEASSIAEAGSSLVLFHETQGILGLDGDGSGGGTWTPSGQMVASDRLQRLTIKQDYAQKTWDLYVDGVSLLQGLGFKDDSVAQLSGVNIETSEDGPGFLDDFAVTADPPDFLADPAIFLLSTEWSENMGGLDWDLFPYAPDGKVGAGDVLELIQRLRTE